MERTPAPRNERIPPPPKERARKRDAVLVDLKRRGLSVAPFKLVEAAQRSWRRLRGYNLLPKVIQGVKFADGIEVVRSQAQAAA
jgi:hypothetical protein